MNQHQHPTAELLAYWLDELDEAAAAKIEEHLFECASCSAALQELVRIGDALRRELRSGNVGTVVSAEFVRRLQADGLRIREYTLRPGESVNCTVAPDDDLVISYLHAPLGEVRQVDLVFADFDGGSPHRSAHIPFDAASGVVTVVPPMAVLRAMGHARKRMQLLAVEDASERVLAEYTFNHAPYDALGSGTDF
ncbi:MAG TPA: zf-HC2 domain-containing protein [Steroidobacteraceae bacterium]|nr:zf-HC2 domain-containing protein [Steroidobacteraceae bacterium]